MLMLDSSRNYFNRDNGRKRLAINLKTARRLGLTIPRSVLLRAELIE